MRINRENVRVPVRRRIALFGGFLTLIRILIPVTIIMAIVVVMMVLMGAVGGSLSMRARMLVLHLDHHGPAPVNQENGKRQNSMENAGGERFD